MQIKKKNLKKYIVFPLETQSIRRYPTEISSRKENLKGLHKERMEILCFSQALWAGRQITLATWLAIVIVMGFAVVTDQNNFVIMCVDPPSR